MQKKSYFQPFQPYYQLCVSTVCPSDEPIGRVFCASLVIKYNILQLWHFIATFAYTFAE